MEPNNMDRPPPDRELLFGMVAASEQFLDAEELIEATIEWSQSKESQSLSDVLLDRGSLTEAQRATVNSLLDNESQQDAKGSLLETVDVGLFGAMRNALERIGDVKVRDRLDQMSEVAKGTSTGSVFNGPLLTDEQRFEIRQELASGGLGDVFIAHDRQLNRNVALKQIKARLLSRPDANERFLIEAEITGRLEHPGVVPVYALGKHADGQCYYAMRLIKGVTLEDEIKTFFDPSESQDPAERNLELRRLMRSFIDVCNAIEYAHSRGVVHRDLKPANIMLGKYGETLVVDWGLAKQVNVEEPATTRAESLLVPGSGSDSAQTQLGSAIGTPHYMSPEQAAGRVDRIGPASDIYSLGATFYHLMVGSPAQKGKSLVSVLEDVERSKFPAPSSVRPDVPKPLEAICLKAMQLSISDRYLSASAMAQDIERWLADQPVGAYREPLVSRAARLFRRHQALAASGTVAMVLLSVAAVAGSVIWQRSQLRQQQHAQEIRQQEIALHREDEQQLEDRRDAAQTNLTLGMREARAGRFDSALGLYQQGQSVCADEPRLSDELADLSQRSGQLTRLVHFDRLTAEAMQSSTFEEDQRSILLFAEALRRLGVFNQADWWDHLPVDDVDPMRANQLEQQVHLQLTSLSSLLAKSRLTAELVTRRALGLPPPKLTAEQERIGRITRHTAEMAQAYRTTQWLERLELSSRFMEGALTELPPPDPWRGDNFVDAFLLGHSCMVSSHSGNKGMASAFMSKFLGITSLKEAGKSFFARATELQPADPLSHGMLAWLRHNEGDFHGARSSVGHAIALRPDLVINYDMRSLTYYEEAMLTEAGQERRRLLTLALLDANSARELAPHLEIVAWLRGNALRGLGQHTLAIAAYLAALDREPPVEMIQLKKWQFIIQGRDPKRVRRLNYVLSDRFDDTKAYAQKRLQDDPENLSLHLLVAATAFALEEWAEAEEAANVILEATKENGTVAPDVESHAFAIRGEVYRHKKDWMRARDDFSSAIRLNPKNALGTGGLAATLKQLAEDSEDPLQVELALAAYEKLAEISFTDWQAVRAEQGRFRMLLKQQDFAAAQQSLDRLLQLDRGQDLARLSRLAKESPEIVAKIDSLKFDVRLDRLLTNQQAAETLPVRNGGFELGLNAHWKPWTIVGQCVSEATIDQQVVGDDGKGDGANETDEDASAALLIRHLSATEEGSYGVLEQVVPSVGGTRYRITLKAKGEEVSANAIRLVVDEGWDQPAAVVPTGTFSWQEISGEFEVPAAEPNASVPPQTSIKIVSTGPGTVWLDDLRVERDEP